ncbi:hypothetical protein ACIP5Y_21160 [Nocardia sp. NPDC088792]|uniref:hypothetical protein n=1 Tax=Nocardia sp. NPDC088792 TaxID=3364332 RepID=UPI0038093266
MSHWSDLLRDAVDFGGDPEPKHDHLGRTGDTDCPACYVDTIREALRSYYDEPEPTLQEVGNPCDHDNAVAGRVEAGRLDGGRYCSVVTCAACLISSQGYVQAITNLPASELIPFTRKVPE